MSADENHSATRSVNHKSETDPPPVLQTTKPKCGIIMPISAIDDCDETHWSEVLQILEDTILTTDFDPALVSIADDVGIIHKRIIQNLYDNPIVVCDVSGKNPNVMFELGLRLAFDKPTIIIKDNRTSYSFDTAVIEHLEYPRDLRFSQINEFKANLAKKIKATYKKSQDDEDYTTFLKHYGQFKIAKIDEKEVPAQEYILEELKSLRTLIQRMPRDAIMQTRRHERQRSTLSNIPTAETLIYSGDGSPKAVVNIAQSLPPRVLAALREKLCHVNGVKELDFNVDDDGVVISAEIDPENFDSSFFENIVKSV